METLVPQVVAHRREDRILNIDVPAAAEEIVREFVAEESKCCSFFSFRIDDVEDGLRLTMETPPGGEGMLAALEAAFRPGASKVPARFEPLEPSPPSAPAGDPKS
jgi:hypothetical protein